MTEDPNSGIEARLAALEKTVADLRRRVDGLAGTDTGHVLSPAQTSPSSTGATDRMAALAGASRRREPRGDAPARPPRDPHAQARPDAYDALANLFKRSPQFWVSRVGIGLLLVGVAYLFKYAVDQGWLTPAIRIVFGLALGAALATIGFRVHRSERWFAQVMLGGASATWYITGFAAFQLLHVMRFGVAFGFLVLVTVYMFVAALQQNEASLAVLATVGGLGTPFFLYTDAGSVPGLMAYTVAVLVGTSAIYYYRGWRSLLWTSVAGAWLVIALGFRIEVLADQIALQGGVIAIWLLFGPIPVLREVLRAPATAGRDDQPTPRTDRSLQSLAVLLVANAVIVFFVSRAVWASADTIWGIVALAGAGVYVVSARQLATRRALLVLTSALGVTAATLVAIACPMFFEEHMVFALWAVEAAALHVAAPHLKARGLSGPDEAILDLDRAAHMLFAGLGLWMVQRLTELGAPEIAVFNAQAGANAIVIVAALVAAGRLDASTARVYQLAAQAAILGWLWRELSSLPAGDGIVTAAWGLYAVALLLFLRPARNIALATLFLAAGKLVVHDLSQVEPIWRILLFLSFGAVFLAISYFFTDLWSGSDGTHDADDAT
jgi:uncharacterized membrane protein